MFQPLVWISKLFTQTGFLLTNARNKVKKLSVMNNISDTTNKSTYVDSAKVAQVPVDTSFKELMVRLRAHNEY